jgi:hypothetical protein
MSWTGWLRRGEGHAWEKACTARTWKLCADRLRKAAERWNVPGSQTLVTGGSQPLAPTARQVRLRKRPAGSEDDDLSPRRPAGRPRPASLLAKGRGVDEGQV